MGMFGRLTQPLDPRVQALVSGNPLPAAPLIGEGSPIRAMMMKPYGDIISDDILRKIYD